MEEEVPMENLNCYHSSFQDRYCEQQMKFMHFKHIFNIYGKTMQSFTDPAFPRGSEV